MDGLVEKVRDAVIPHIEDRRTVRRFFGRRSMDKSCGEVVHDLDPFGAISDDTFQVVERIERANFAGEVAASERAHELGDQWTADQIARAAIEAVFDALGDRAQESIDAAFERETTGATTGRAIVMASGVRRARVEAWTAMLATLRKQALG